MGYCRILLDLQDVLISLSNAILVLTLGICCCILNLVVSLCGRIAQLGEHLPYKQGVIGSSPIVPTIDGPVVQLVRMPACHAGGRRFEPVLGRHSALVAQSVEQRTENPRVGGSIPPQGTIYVLRV